MDNQERDKEIAALYTGGPGQVPLSAPKLAIKFGLSVPTIRRILAEQEAKRHPNALKPTADDRVLDPAHRIIGGRLYNYRFSKLHDPNQGAHSLGWSVKKLRGIEQGFSEISLADLQDMAEYMNTSVSELTRNI